MRRITLFPLIFALALCVGFADAAAHAQGWGTLKGQFVYDGDPPKPEDLNITKDVAVCGKANPKDESLVVDPESKGIANIFVYMYLRPSDSAPEAHPSYQASANSPVQLDNEGCRFEPHCAVLRTSQTLVLKNTDPVTHNVKIDARFKQINPSMPPGGMMKEEFPGRELLPAKVACSIHPWMEGWLFVVDHPYATVTDKEGKFEIKNIPAGEWTFRVWQEKAGYVQEVTLDGQETEWKYGRFPLEIKSGEAIDLGKIEVEPKVFNKPF